MAYGAILGQTPTASNVTYNNSQTSSIITGTNVQQAIDQLFTSVSNGKQQIASAITDKGVSTSADASFAQMAANIGSISTIPNYVGYGFAGNNVTYGIGVKSNNFLSGLDLSIYKSGIYSITFVSSSRDSILYVCSSLTSSRIQINTNFYQNWTTSNLGYATIPIFVEYSNNKYQCYIDSNLFFTTNQYIYITSISGSGGSTSSDNIIALVYQ